MGLNYANRFKFRTQDTPLIVYMDNCTPTTFSLVKIKRNQHSLLYKSKASQTMLLNKTSSKTNRDGTGTQAIPYSCIEITL